MSRAFVAFYMGDYQKKTQHLDTLQHGAYGLLLQHCWTHGAIPLEPEARAAIARMTVPAWKKIAPIIDRFFDSEGRNKRATKEIEKAERVSLKRAMAGQKGGFSSGISKSIAKGQQLRSAEVANATALLKQTPKQKPTNSEPNKNRKIESTSTAAREGPEISKQTGGSLATAHSEGARREPPSGGADDLMASLDRLRVAQGRNCFVERDTPEWHAHQHDRQIRELKPLHAITVTVEGVEKTGLWLESMVPEGYDPATCERMAPASEENVE